MRLYGVVEDIGNLVYPFIQIGTVVGIEVYVPVAGDIKLSVSIFEIMGGRQLIDVLEKSFGCRGILKGQIIFQSRLVKFLDKIGVSQKSLYFRAEHERSVHLGVVHGLDSEKVPRTEKLFFDCIPYYKGEHPAQLVQKLFAVLLIAVENDFGIGIAAEFMSQIQQLPAYRLIVVYLAVEQENFCPVLVVHRLIPRRGDVDNAQPAEA